MEPEDQAVVEPTDPNETLRSGDGGEDAAFTPAQGERGETEPRSPNPQSPTPDPQQELARLREELAAASRRAVAAHQRALQAEHAGRVVPELIQGETIEALDASIAGAVAAYQSIRAATIAEIGASTTVSAGNGTRGRVPDMEGLSPLAKIAYGLRRTED